MTKQTKDGRTASVKVVGDGRYVVSINGAEIATGLMCKQMVAGEAKWVVAGKLLVTDAEAATIEAELHEWYAANHKPSRRDLVTGWQGAMDTAHHLHETAIGSEAPYPYAKIAEADAKAEAARVALAEYDAQHPDEIAALEAERAERTARNQWM